MLVPVPTRCVGAALARGQLLRPNPFGLDRDQVFLNPCRVAARTNTSRPAFGNIESLGSMSSPREARPATGTVALTYQAHISPINMGSKLAGMQFSACVVSSRNRHPNMCALQRRSGRSSATLCRPGYRIPPAGLMAGYQAHQPGFPYKPNTSAGPFRGGGW